MLTFGEKLILDCGAEMAGIWRWVAKSARHQFDSHDIRLSVIELARKRAFFVDMQRVLIGWFTLPALDKPQKALAFATVELWPEQSRVLAGAFSSDPKTAGYTGLPAAPWSASHFKLKVIGLETESAAVTKIDVVTFNQKMAKHFYGPKEASIFSPVGTNWNSLRVSFPHPHLPRIQQWHRSIAGGSTYGPRASLEHFSARWGAPVFKLGFNILPVSVSSTSVVECVFESVQAEP